MADFNMKLLDLVVYRLSYSIVITLEIAMEAFEELSDATGVTFIEDTLVLQENGTMT